MTNKLTPETEARRSAYRSAAGNRKVTIEISSLLLPLLRNSQRAASVLEQRKKRPKQPGPNTVAARQARRLESARRAILKEFGTLDARGDYEKLKQERKIFTVTYRNATYVPNFQFDDRGRPCPAVARVIQILGKDTSDWGLALWFTAANGWLDGKRPVDLLQNEPEEVVQAAEHEAAELVF